MSLQTIEIEAFSGPTSVLIGGGNQPTIVYINQGPMGGGGGGDSVWGAITGTLSDQTDLQDALDLKANLESPVFTGVVTAPRIDGKCNGLELLSKAGQPITAGQVVYVTGASGTNIIVGLAQGNSEPTSSKTIGVSESTLATNDIGYVITEGLMNVNILSPTAVVGDPIWLSGSTPGGMLFGALNKPSYPNHIVYLGVVTRKTGNTISEIYVKVQNGLELDELSDVSISSPVANQALVNDGSKWVNLTLGTAAFTDAETTATILEKIDGAAGVTSKIGSEYLPDSLSGSGSPGSKVAVSGSLSYNSNPIIFPVLLAAGQQDGVQAFSSDGVFATSGTRDILYRDPGSHLWLLARYISDSPTAVWISTSGPNTPDLVVAWIPLGASAGTPIIQYFNAIASSYIGQQYIDTITDTWYRATASGVSPDWLKDASLISPSFTTPSLGTATATSINKVAITQPATGATLTIADGVTINARGNITTSNFDGGISISSYGGITTGSGGSITTSTGPVVFSNTGGDIITINSTSNASATLPVGISTLARTDSGGGTQTFSGPQAMSSTLSVTGALTGTTASFSNTVAGTATTPAVNIASTWTTTGAPTALKVNVTASPDNTSASSLLMDVQLNGASQFKVLKSLSSYSIFEHQGAVVSRAFITPRSYLSNGDIGLTGLIGWSNGPQSPSAPFFDLVITRDAAAGALAQRNGTNAQTSRVYGTYTSATNYERLGIEAGKTGGTAEHVIDSQKGSGGGSLLPIRLKMGGTTSLEVGTTGHVTASGTVKAGGYTVATLPTPTVGMRCHVTDANSTTFYSAVAGGGSNIVPVFYNGTNWVIA